MLQLLHKYYSLTFPPLSVARYSFIQLSKLRHHGENENAQAWKQQQRGFEPGHPRLRDRWSIAELPRSTCGCDIREDSTGVLYVRWKQGKLYLGALSSTVMEEHHPRVPPPPPGQFLSPTQVTGEEMTRG